VEKHRFAEKLTALYAGAGIKVLITAAAIGIDEVKVREQIPLHRQIRQQLFDSGVEVFPGSKGSQAAETTASRRAGRPLPARHVIRVFEPLTVPLDDPPEGEALFDRGQPITPSYAIRSGENGFFSVADADALYRTMKVASASELGLMLATVGLLGDDRLSPWFRDNVCYYTETDNSREVFDFLSQPALFRTQLTGLDPMALQDLGSAKHQGEHHTLALLILLHRLRDPGRGCHRSLRRSLSGSIPRRSSSNTPGRCCSKTSRRGSSTRSPATCRSWPVRRHPMT